MYNVHLDRGNKNIAMTEVFDQTVYFPTGVIECNGTAVNCANKRCIGRVSNFLCAK